MNPIRPLFLVAALIAGCSACSLVAGQAEGVSPSSPPAVHLSYTETLKDQESLRSQRFSSGTDYSTDPAISLQRPSSVFADAFRVYVVDQNPAPRVFVFNRNERTAAPLNIPAAPTEGKLLNPTGIAVDASNVIYVADGPQGKVFGFDRTGTLVLVFGKAGMFVYPSAVAVDRHRDRVYIADSQDHLVKAFSGSGQLLFELRGEGTAKGGFKNPAGIAVDAEGRIHVLDTQARRVVLFGPDGAFLSAFSLGHRDGGGGNQPQGIAVDREGRVYVSDGTTNNIFIYGPDGTLIESWGKTGIVQGDFWSPRGLFIDDRDLLYIADQNNGRVQVYQIMP
ncbi:MAG: hypothetical protein M0042_11655 [Nitrospiraceae bacterium]|nr:hypothetical protein [Nitrospiraceae bacterium]